MQRASLTNNNNNQVNNSNNQPPSEGNASSLESRVATAVGNQSLPTIPASQAQTLSEEAAELAEHLKTINTIEAGWDFRDRCFERLERSRPVATDEDDDEIDPPDDEQADTIAYTRAYNALPPAFRDGTYDEKAKIVKETEELIALGNQYLNLSDEAEIAMKETKEAEDKLEAALDEQKKFLDDALAKVEEMIRKANEAQKK